MDVLNAGLNDDIIKLINQIQAGDSMEDYQSNLHNLVALRTAIDNVIVQAGDATLSKQTEILSRLNDNKSTLQTEHQNISNEFPTLQSEHSELLNSIQDQNGTNFDSNQHSLQNIASAVSGLIRFDLDNIVIVDRTYDPVAYGSDNERFLEEIIVSGAGYLLNVRGSIAAHISKKSYLRVEVITTQVTHNFHMGYIGGNVSYSAPEASQGDTSPFKGSLYYPNGFSAKFYSMDYPYNGNGYCGTTGIYGLSYYPIS